jgi:hypothetical protein
VRQYFPDRDPLAGGFFYGYPQVDRKNVTRIVGVVDDVRFRSLAQPDESTYYLPAAQQGGFALLRTSIVVAPADGNPRSQPPRRRVNALNSFDRSR